MIRYIAKYHVFFLHSCYHFKSTEECHWHNDMHNQLHIDKCTADSAHQYRMYCTRLCAQVLNLRTLKLEACFQLCSSIFYTCIK